MYNKKEQKFTRQKPPCGGLVTAVLVGLKPKRRHRVPNSNVFTIEADLFISYVQMCRQSEFTSVFQAPTCACIRSRVIAKSLLKVLLEMIHAQRL